MLKSCIQLSQYDRCQTQRPEEFEACRPFQIHRSALGIPRQSTTVQNLNPLIGEFETACMLQILLVAEFGTDHIEKAVCMISAWIFSKNVRGIKLKFGEEIEQHLSDRNPSSDR